MPTTLIATWADYEDALSRTIAAATQQLWIFDHDLAACGLEKPDRHEQLVAFLRGSPHARLQIALRDPQRLQTSMPRTLKFLTTFGHITSVTRTPDRLAHLRDSMVLTDRRCGVVRFDHNHPRGKMIVDDEDESAPYIRRFEEILAEGGDRVTPGVLGL